MIKDAPDWLVEVCRRMRWDVSEWNATDSGDWQRDGEIGDGDPDITVLCADDNGEPLAIRWELGWYQQVGDVDYDWSVADIIESFCAASRAQDASLDASRAARDTDTDTDTDADDTDDDTGGDVMSRSRWSECTECGLLSTETVACPHCGTYYQQADDTDTDDTDTDTGRT